MSTVSFRGLSTRTSLVACLLWLIVLVRFSWAAPPVFDLPVKCSPGRDCVVQNYFDHDPGPAFSDYTCGSLSYNGHDGTDIRLLDLAAMRRSFAVLASAAGVVVAVRDGEPDVDVRARGRKALKGRYAGNSVRVDHGDGWETQYSHLQRGSVLVRPGQKVASGELLGYVGLSGDTEFPHVEFRVSRYGKAVDPFYPVSGKCGLHQDMLWSEAAASQLSYRAGGLLISGFSSAVPIQENAESGAYAFKEINADAVALIYWVELFGLRRHDRLVMELFAPDGRRLAHSDRSIPDNKALWFAYAGKKRTLPKWPTGVYKAVFRLERYNLVMATGQQLLTVR